MQVFRWFLVVVVVQFLSHVWLFATPWTAARQASLSLTISQSLPKFMSIESVMLSNHLILCHSLLLLPSIFPSIKVFSSESALHIRSPKYWCFSFQSLNSLFIMYGRQFHLPHWLFQLHLLSWGCDYSPQIGLSWFLRWQRICPQCERPKFDPWVGKIPWRREWKSTLIFLPGEFHRAWLTTVHVVAKSQTGLSNFHFHEAKRSSILLTHVKDRWNCAK